MVRKRIRWTKKSALDKKKKTSDGQKNGKDNRILQLFRENSKKQAKLALPFLAGIGFFFLIFFVIISSINLYPLKSFAATASSGLLSFFGVQNRLIFAAEPTIVVTGVNAQITNLCAGDIEIALLLAIILATWDRSWRKRFWGCLLGFLFVLLVNPLRIFFVLLAGSSFGWNVADAVHGVLFRVMLLLIIIGYYFLWYVKYNEIAAKFTFLTEKSQKKYKKN